MKNTQRQSITRYKRHLNSGPDFLPGPACRGEPLGAPSSSVPRPFSPPADAPPAAGGCPRQSSAVVPHLGHEERCK